MKLSDAPPVLVENLVSRIDLFLKNNKLPPVCFSAPRRKSLEKWYGKNAVYDSKQDAHLIKIAPEYQMLRFQWDRNLVVVNHTTTMFITLDEAKQTCMDSAMRITAGNSQRLSIRVYHRGDKFRFFRWHIERSLIAKAAYHKGENK
jgi:hypothetical protein